MNYMKEALARCGYDEDPVYEGSVLISNLGTYKEEYYQRFDGYDGMDIDEVIECIPFEKELDFVNFVLDYTDWIREYMERESLDKYGYVDYNTIDNTVDIVHRSMYNDMEEISNRVWDELFKIKEEINAANCLTANPK